MLQRKWFKAVISLTLCLLTMGLAQPCRAAEESMQALMLRKLFATPLDGWRKVLEDNKNILDTSFFQRVEARIRWSIDNGQFDDALRFALAGDTAGAVVKRKTDYRIQMSQLFRHRGLIVFEIPTTIRHGSDVTFFWKTLSFPYQSHFGEG